jgi:phosphoribosylformylglycinamidine synthase II
MGLLRFEVFSRPGLSDPVARETLQNLHDFNLTRFKSVRFSQLYLVDLEVPAIQDSGLARRIADELLADRVTHEYRISSDSEPVDPSSDSASMEVHFRPGVMDNVGDSTRSALADMGINARSVRTARRYDLSPAPLESELPAISRILGNDCIEEVVSGGKPMATAPDPPQYQFRLQTVPLRGLSPSDLMDLSRRGHLFLTQAEMRAIQSHYQALQREPTDLELETIAQTWSEHCIHKTLKSAIEYRGAPFPNHPAVSPTDFKIHYDNLLKDTIARATNELMHERRGPECLSVFKDNAGIIGFDDRFGLAFKVETHNHPSAIEPYGGAATGVGGVIRDVLGCGLGAKPLANTDVFCVAPPDWPLDAVPQGVIHPRSVLKGVVAGVRDYGNRMGIPTVNGAVHFDPRYLGNPLVYCGCLGLIPRDRIEKQVHSGDLIVVIGGRTGRDGIHGATFSSVEMAHGHQDEFAHAVQIGNAIEEKKVLDVILQARDFNKDGRSVCLFSAITDCGAGGLSSAIGEMAAESGAIIHLDRVPLKYSGLRYDEIWISEAQERMVLSVPPENMDALQKLCAGENVEASVLGEFTDTRRLDIRYRDQVVGNIDLQFLHEGFPRQTLQAEWQPLQPSSRRSAVADTKPQPAIRIVDQLKKRLSDPTIASKHWIIRQYDHEVQGRSIIKPLTGRHDGPSDAAVLRPRLDSYRGVALGCGLAPELADIDPYWMAIAAIDEAVRNVVCVGGDPRQTAILDNFCWPRVDNPRHLGALVRACQACYDMSKALALPFISGKDSLNNEFSVQPDDAAMQSRLFAARWPHLDSSSLQKNRLAIPYTLLISAMSIVEDTRRCVTSAAQPTNSESSIYLITTTAKTWPEIRLPTLATMHAHVADLIRDGKALAVHDVSDGGILTALAEMVIANDLSCRVLLPALEHLPHFDRLPSAYLVQSASPLDATPIDDILIRPVAILPVGPDSTPVYAIADKPQGYVLDQIFIADLRRAWKQPLDW